jgi:hypothetical protein
MASDFTCSNARAEYSKAIRIVDDYAIFYFAKPSFIEGHPRRDGIVASLTHIRGCPECQIWLKNQVPVAIFERHERASHYCCFTMFVAVEEKGGNRVTFELYRNEDPCWKIDGKRSFISFCPWCGSRLPDKPFTSIDESPNQSKDPTP